MSTEYADGGIVRGGKYELIRVCADECIYGRDRRCLRTDPAHLETGAHGKSWILTLPWTRPPLSLNDRGQTPGARAAKSELVRKVKAAVILRAKVAKIGEQQAIHVRLHWQPRDRRRRDPDNLVATLKPCIDGLVAAGIVPDDCPPYVDWSAPRIHPPSADRVARLWLEVTA